MENIVLMPSDKTPTIKGMFVQSHIEKLRKEKGESTVTELERQFGRPLFFRRLEDVPVRDEAKLIELIYDLLNEGHTLSPQARERAAGRLHFANFAETTFGSMLMNSMPHSKATFHTMLFNIGSIGRSVIRHIEFRTEDIRGGMRVSMKNSEYPPEHFRGFFEEWVAQWDLDYAVTCVVKGPGVHEYRITV